MKFLGFLNTRIGQRFLAIFLTISLLPMVTVGWFAIKIGESALRRQTRSVLRAASDAAEGQLREFLLHLKEETLALSQDSRICAALEAIRPAAGLMMPSAVPADLGEILFRQKERLPEAHEVFVLDPNGRVAASSESKNVGKDLSSVEYFLRGQQAFFPDDVAHDPESGQISWVMMAPVKDATSQHLLGVVACRMGPGTLSALTTGRRILAEGADTQSFRIGDTGETYIVNRDRLMITESRYFPNSILKVKVDTLAVHAALERGQEITEDYKDYHGVAVGGTSMILRDMGWVVLTEIDFSQVFAPIRHLRTGLAGLTVALGLMVTVLAWSSARGIVRPLHMLKQSDHALAGGDDTAALVSEQNLPADEIGEFVRLRNARVKALLEQQRQLLWRRPDGPFDR